MIVQRTPSLGLSIRLQRIAAEKPAQEIQVSAPRWAGYLTAAGEPMRDVSSLDWGGNSDATTAWVAEVPGAITVDWDLSYELWLETLAFSDEGVGSVARVVVDVIPILTPEPTPQPAEGLDDDYPHHQPPWPRVPTERQVDHPVFGWQFVSAYLPAVIPAGNTLTVFLDRRPLWSGLLRARANVDGRAVGELTLALHLGVFSPVPNIN